MKILVVADGEDASNLIQLSLQKEGFSVDAVDLNAILKVAQGYNLILLDMIDNLTVIRKLRKKQISAPILCLSTKDTVVEMIAGLNAGADDCLPKPFVFDELVARIHALIRRGTCSLDVELIYASLRLNPVSHKVWFHGTGLNLSVKEYDVLAYFMRHPEQILTREMIVENSWSEKTSIFSNCVEVYISYLRSKMGRVDGIKLIQTIRGTGYILKKE